MTCLLPVAFEPLGWIHDMDWYQEMLRASWFKPILPYWRDYNLDWVLVGVLIVLVLLLLKAIFGRRVKLTKGPARAKKQRKLALKAAEHYLQAGEKMMAVDAFLAASQPENALALLVEMKSWARAGTLAEQMGKVDEAVEYFGLAKDTVSVVRILQKAGRLEEAAQEYEKQERLVDAAKLYLDEGKLSEAAELYMRVRMHSRAAELFFDDGKKEKAIACLQELLSDTSAGFTDEECKLLAQGAAILYKQKKVMDSARMLEAAGEIEGAASRYEICGARNEAARCYEKLGKARKAADLTEDPQQRLALLQSLQREGKKVEPGQMAQALSAAGQHEDAVELFLEMGDKDAAVRECVDAGNPSDGARILSEQGNNLDAAKLFVEAGDLDSARQQFLLAGDKSSAASVAQRMGLYLRAGEEFFSIGKQQEAVSCLQKIDPSDPDFRMASSVLGRVFAAMGDGEMAMRMHKRATANLALKKDNLELFYNLARFLESLGGKESSKQARATYAGILDVDYGFKDANDRLQGLS